MGKRIDLPLILSHLDAKELLGFFRRGLREKNKHELRKIKAEFDRRGVKLNNKDFFAYKRIMGK